MVGKYNSGVTKGLGASLPDVGVTTGDYLSAFAGQLSWEDWLIVGAIVWIGAKFLGRKAKSKYYGTQLYIKKKRREQRKKKIEKYKKEIKELERGEGGRFI